MYISGYDGFGPNAGIHVDKENALDYVLRQVGYERSKSGPLNPELSTEFEAMVEEWFFSGDWL